jgi:stress-induced morphogen
MAGKNKKKNHDPDVEQILELLNRDYLPSHPQAEIAAYRQNSVSIRLRIIDPDFRGKNRVARDRRISALLAKLPEGVESQISVLLLLTPEETRMSFANFEFEDPVPSTV